MSYPLDKKAVYMARYPKGSVLELTAPIDDPYSPKPVGCDTVINFDIQWNPVSLIQRFGRIDRIGNDEVYSMAVKRLSQTDDMQIVVEQTLLTDKYMLGIPDSNRDRFMAYMNYSTVKNKIDKVQLYKEWFYKAYMVVNEKAYIHTDKLLDGNTWYDSDRTARICQKYVELVTSRGKLKTAVTNAERMKINKEIKKEVQELTECI